MVTENRGVELVGQYISQVITSLREYLPFSIVLICVASYHAVYIFILGVQKQ